MQTSSLRRQMKNMVNNYTEAEIKVREATSNDPWGPPSSLMSEIADLTFNVVAFAEVMGMIWKRLNDHGKNWRHVYKALTLLDYLIKTGSERVAQECRENVFSVQTLRDFQHVDRDGRDQGVNVREKAKHLVALLKDEEKLKKERSQALKTKTRMAGVSGSLSSSSLPPPYPGRRTSQPSREEFERGSPSSVHSSSSSPRLAPDMEQARPTTSGEEELQLQLALAMSREESEKPPSTVDIDERTQLQIAVSLSKEVQKPPVQPAPAALDMDEDTQLQLALSMSKEEHQQEQLSRQGDESMLLKALEESKREMESKGGTAFMDLVDVFAVPSEQPAGERGWSDTRQRAVVRGAASDPWDSLEGGANTGVDPPWMAPPPSNSPPPPWEPSRPPGDPWNGLQADASDLGAAGRAWGFPSGSAVDPFSAPSGGASPRAGSPSDGDLFNEAMDGGPLDVNGRGGGSPELFDMSRLSESLVAPSPRSCRTPEAFLGPTGASLVNLDTLIPANPSSKTKNPFLSDGTTFCNTETGPELHSRDAVEEKSLQMNHTDGLSAPSATNPFQTEPARLTLNQMGSGSALAAPPAAASLPYSASLPLPVSHQPASLPSSLTHPTQPGLELPEPLLPLSGAAASAQSSQNPFL